MQSIDYDLMTSALLTVQDVLDEGRENSTDIREVNGVKFDVGSESLRPALLKYGLDEEGIIDHVGSVIQGMQRQGLVTHPMGASIVATQYITGIFLGMQLALDRVHMESPESFFGGGS